MNKKQAKEKAEELLYDGILQVVEFPFESLEARGEYLSDSQKKMVYEQIKTIGKKLAHRLNYNGLGLFDPESEVRS